MLILLASNNKHMLLRWEQGLFGLFPTAMVHSFQPLTERLGKLRPDILLLDYALPGLKNQQSISELINVAIETKIVIFSSGFSDDIEWRLLKIGVKGCCLSDLNAAQIKRVIDVISQGELWFRRSLTNRILSELVKVTFEKNRIEQAVRDLLENLTRREYEIAMLVSRGDSNKKIAQQLAITERTVKAHLTEIFRKLHISDRIKLALIMKDIVKSS
ncbi:MAG: response regulator transcription factor [Nitrosomonas sp.]